MYICIELIELNDEFGATHWLDRSTLFGVSEERDKLLIRNLETLQKLFELGTADGFTNFQSFHQTYGKFKCYSLISCDDLVTIKRFFYSETFNDYVDSTKQVCDIYGWTYHGHRIVPENTVKTVDVENLNIDIVDGLWDKTIPIYPPVF